MNRVRVGVGFAVSASVAAALGSIIQTGFNMAAIASLGVALPLGTVTHTVVEDLLRFAPLYGGLVAVALLCAFAIARRAAARFGGSRQGWFALAGMVAVLALILILNFAFPLTPIAATRSPLAIVLMSLAGGVGGWLYARLVAGAPVNGPSARQ